VYVVTDPDASLPVVEQVRAAAQGGASQIQLRDKRASDADIAALVTMLLPALTTLGVALMINDRVEVACATGAHGVHIGQGDGDPIAIRRRIGPEMILGLSVVSLDQARVVPACVDYIGAGPIRETATKPDHAPPIGFDGLAQITAATRVPTYAIAGITLGDAAALKAAGAIGIAVVSAVTRAADADGVSGVDAPIVLDPVMVAKSGARLLRADAVAALREVLQFASVITPNLPEAADLLDAPEATSRDDMERQAEALLALGAKAVLLKGGHLSGIDCPDLLATGAELIWLPGPRHTTRQTHGTGCTLSSALATFLGRGLPLGEAAPKAKAYVAEAIAHADALTVGTGNGPTHHFHAFKQGHTS